MSKPDLSTSEGLPSSVHTEIAILGCMLLEEEAINVAIEKLVASDFSLDSHQRIFRSIMDLAETGNPVDLTTVRVELERRRELDAVGGAGYIAYLTEGIPRNFSIESYVRIVKDKSLLRQVLCICHDGQVRASDQSEEAMEVVSSIEEQLLELAHQGPQRGFVSILDTANDAGGVDRYVERMCDPVAMTGLPTGYKELDTVLGGLQRRELILIGARASQGKSSLGLCIAANVVMADSEAVVAFFSIEMSTESLHERLLAMLGSVNIRKAQQGWASREERTRLQSALIKIGDKHLLIDDTASITATQIRAKCRRLKQKHGRLDLVVVDYLQIVRGSKKYGNRQEEVSDISRSLKAAAKELDVPLVALAQIGRSAEQRGGDKRPMLSDLRESGSLEQDSDVVLLIYRASYYAHPDDDDTERGTAEIIVAKQRRGPTGTRKLAFLEEFTRFDNLETNHEV